MFVRSARPSLTLSIGLAVLAAAAAPARAAPVLNEVHTIAAATTGTPVEETFSVTAAGTYTITLTDLGAALTPSAPLASAKLAVTSSSDALVGGVLTLAGASTTLTLTSLPAGSYQLHVVGMPGNTPGSGPISIQIAGPAVSPAAFLDTLALPSGALPNGEAVLDSSFTVPASGNYSVTLSDLQLPQSLTTLELLLVPAGGAPLATLSAAGSTTVALSTGVTYDIFAVGAAGAPANAGLFGVVVAPSGGGTVVFGRAIPVGNTIQVGTPALAAGSATLILTDLNYPAGLSQLEAATALSGQLAAPALTASGQTSFTAVSGTYAVFAYAAAPAGAPGAGSYAVQLTQGGRPALAVGRAVVAAGSAESVYAFDSSITTAGTYTLSASDFQIPAPLTVLNIGVVQAGALVGTPLTAAAKTGVSGSVTAVAGPVSVFAIADAPAAGGLYGIELAPAAGGAPAFEVTQAVGSLFGVQQVTITNAGTYTVTATDLGFPASFANFDTIITQGTTLVGSVFGGGTFNFAATPGTYYVNFVAQPTGTDEAGTYALTIAPAPPPPVVTLSVDNPQVSAGSTVDIIWSSQNATTCAASGGGGWSGTQALSGTATSAALSANTTFTLTCTGAGGSTAKSVMVTVTAASSGGHGGGAIDVGLLGLLCGLLLLRLGHVRVRRHRRMTPARVTCSSRT